MNTERTLLEVLNAAPHFAMPESRIADALRIATAAPMKKEEALEIVRTTMRALEAKGQVVGEPDEDRGQCWQITINGKVRVK